MQERSRGSKRFELGDVSPSDSLRGVEQPTRASIYQEDHTPAHWPPPTDASARGMQGKPRAPRDGLIASQLGLPTQTRASAQSFPPDSWQTQAAADGDWPLDDYHYDYAAGSGRQLAAAYPEYATYGEDADLQASLDLDNSQGLHDEQLAAYYGAANPPLDLRLPPVAAGHALTWGDDEVETSHYARPGQHKTAATGKYPFAQVARQSSQPSAAKWQAQQPIQRVGSPNAGRAPAQPAQPGHNIAPNPYTTGAPPRARAAGRTANTQLNRTANAPGRNAPGLNRNANAQAGRNAPNQLNRTAAAQRGAVRPAARSFVVDDEPISYPKSRGSGWLKRFVFLLCVAGGAYVARDQIAPAFLTAPAPRPAPTPVAAPTPAIPEAAPDVPTPASATTPEPVAAPAPETLAPQADAKARRSAARAAIIAERWRERRAARHAQDDSTDDSADRADTTANEPAPTTHYTPKPQPQPGVLRINSRPWSNIFVDGQPVGHTPQMNLQLPSGQHQITLINNEMQLRKAINVTIVPGETTTQTINLAE